MYITAKGFNLFFYTIRHNAQKTVLVFVDFDNCFFYGKQYIFSSYTLIYFVL